MTRRLSRIFTGVAALSTLFFTSLPAFAEEPFALSSNFIDSAKAVKDDSALLAKITEVPGADLWVVLVKDFSGMDAQDWVKQTFNLTGLQKYDGLVAISTTTRELGFYAHKKEGITQKKLDEALNPEVLGLLKAEKWDAGITKLAENVSTLVNGGSLKSPSSGGMIGLVGGAVVIGGCLWIFSRRKKKQRAAAAAKDLQTLSEEASSALLKTDDAVRSAAAEVEFARAEFGLQATQEFAKTLQEAKDALDHGFAIRRLLDDPDPETPAQQRQMNQEILALVQQADDALKAQQEDFQKLRDLAARVPEKTAELSTRVSELRTQIPLLAAKIDHLKLKFPAAMLQSLQTYPAQIESLLTAVENSLQQAQTHLATNDRNSAVPYAKMAEETLSQAATLFTRIDAAPQELGAAKERFAANIASLTADISDANKLGHQNPLISEAKTVAEALISRAKSTTNPDYLALNAELKETEAKLDALLAPVREAAEVHQRLQENVKIVMHTAQDTITAADEFIHRYRSGVGANSRTLLARAKAHYQRAATAPLAQQITIYQEAISAAQQSIHTAERALSQEKMRVGSNSGGDFLAGMIVSSVLNGIFNDHDRGSSFSDFGGGFTGFGGGSESGFGGGRKGF